MQNWHDAEIIGLQYEKETEALFVFILLANKEKYTLKFKDVVDWSFSPFESQNIIFDVHEYDDKNLPDEIKQECQIPEEYLKMLCEKSENTKTLFYIESSVGLNGYIIAKEVV
jgi:hypothetical protein